jgi:hypothetical protein
MSSMAKRTQEYLHRNVMLVMLDLIILIVLIISLHRFVSLRVALFMTSWMEGYEKAIGPSVVQKFIAGIGFLRDSRFRAKPTNLLQRANFLSEHSKSETRLAAAEWGRET